MKRLFKHLLILMACLWFTNALASMPMNNSLAPMLEKVLPSVVNIRAQIKVTDLNTLNRLQQQQNRGPVPNGPLPDKFLSVGSGVIIDAKNGYILTNAHVVADAINVVVTLADRHHYTAKIIGVDRASDVAVLQIKAKELTSLPFGNSNLLKVGDVVAAIGNPFGLNQTVTSGIVSGLGRATLGIENFENFIQTDAPINPGNSGGALIDTAGNLVGLNTAILAPNNGSVGIGFAIPANMVKSVMLQLIAYGDVKRGILGVGAQDITPDLANAFGLGFNNGAVVTQVIPNSPAAYAGLKVGDIITAVNDMPISNANDVVNSVGLIRVNSNATIKLLRENKAISVNAQLTDLGKRKEISQTQDPYLYGTSLQNFTVSNPIHGDVQGVMVISVEEDSSAWRSDLRPGDVIISVNKAKVNNVDELRKQVSQTKTNLVLNVIRGPGAVFLVISK